MADDGKRYHSPAPSGMNDARGERIVVFTRIPQVGRVKTRLIPSLGAAGAAELHAQMMQHAIRQATTVAEWRGATCEVRFTGGGEAAMRRWVDQDVLLKPQHEGDLGDRLRLAIEESFHQGAQRVIAIGADCPELDAARMSIALDALHRREVVLGPALDGGYYLIGMRRNLPELFRDVDWGTDKVAEQTRERIKAAGLSMTELKPLGDVDEPDDLDRWHRIKTARAACKEPSSQKKPKVSVIIPTLNEAYHLPMTLASACCEHGAEVLIVDGGSTDKTIEIANGFDVRVITSEQGRSSQMNAGAAVARGEVLLFLHADTRLPFDYRAAIDRVLAQPNVVAGAFRFALDRLTPSLRLIEIGTNLRCRVLQLPYGDQAIFLPRSTFERLGGFRPLPVMEDFEFVRRSRRYGRIGIADAFIITSARRWLGDGPLRTTMRHQVAIARYMLGHSPDVIAAWLKPDTDEKEHARISEKHQSTDISRTTRATGEHHACERV